MRKLERFAGLSSRRVRGNTTRPYAHAKTEKYGKIPAGQATITVRKLWEYPQSGHSEVANVLHDSRRRSTGEVRELRTVRSQRKREVRTQSIPVCACSVRLEGVDTCMQHGGFKNL